ncbi:putative galectin [Trypoxylus dichotomus]
MFPLNWIHLSARKCLFLTIFLAGMLSYNLSEAHTYTWPLPMGLSDGNMITVKGSLPVTGRLFHINFMTESNFTNGDIIFHISYRYADKLLVFNTRNAANWMTEERYTDITAVKAGKYFTILIVYRYNQYMVTTNGRHFVTFNICKPSSCIKYMSIDTDVNLSSVTFESDST